MKHLKTYEEKEPDMEELLKFADRVLSGNGVADSLKVGDIVKHNSSINTYIVEILETTRKSPKNKKVDRVKYKSLLYHPKEETKWSFVKKPQILFADRDTVNFRFYYLTKDEINSEIGDMLNELEIKIDANKYNL